MSAIAGVNGVYVGVDARGNVFFVDGNAGNRVPGGSLGAKGKAPFSVACGLGAGVETCVIVDAAGNCWRGPARPTAGRQFDPVS
jgi:hypothetical protein